MRDDYIRGYKNGYKDARAGADPVEDMPGKYKQYNYGYSVGYEDGIFLEKPEYGGK